MLVCWLSNLLHYVSICGDVSPWDYHNSYAPWMIAWRHISTQCDLFYMPARTTTFFGLIPTGGNESYLVPLYAVTWWYGPSLAQSPWLTPTSKRTRLLAFVVPAMAYFMMLAGDPNSWVFTNEPG